MLKEMVFEEGPSRMPITFRNTNGSGLAIWKVLRQSYNRPLGLVKRCAWKTRSLEALGHSRDELELDGIVEGLTEPREGCLINDDRS